MATLRTSWTVGFPFAYKSGEIGQALYRTWNSGTLTCNALPYLDLDAVDLPFGGALVADKLESEEYGLARSSSDIDAVETVQTGSTRTITANNLN